MLELAGINEDPTKALDDGRAYATWIEMVKAQGGDPNVKLPVADKKEMIVANKSGYITKLDAYAVGLSAWRLGAGRVKKEDDVSKIAGIICVAKEGDFVEEGQPILELHIDDESRLKSAKEALQDAFEISPEALEPRKIVIERIA